MTEPDPTREIERKFQVDSGALPFSLEGRSGSRIEQGYLAVEDTQAREVRIRNRDGHYTLTVKTGRGVVRGEGEVALSAQQFQALWPFTEWRRIAKTRYEIDLGDLTAELDIYASQHTGLAVVEVEFPDKAAARRFDPPDWFGDEVTDNAAYSNQQLALAGARPE